MYRLIIVDDEFEIRNGLSRYFPWESVGVEAAAVFENARGALDYIRRNPVDVVLTDIEMPGMSGIELARVIHEQRLPVKVIFLSAYKKFEYARDAISYRVVHYITITATTRMQPCWRCAATTNIPAHSLCRKIFWTQTAWNLSATALTPSRTFT